jgi:hypothetical protein
MKTLLARKQILFLLIVLTLAQFACNFGAQASSAATQPSSPTSAPQAIQPAPSGSGNCDVNPYLPVKAGATYTFAGTTSAGAYTRTSTFTNVQADSFQAEEVTTVGNKSTTTTESWQCTADGLVQPGGPLAATLQNALSGTTTMKLTSMTGATVPTNLAAGQSWTQSTNFEVTTSKGTVTGTITYALQAIGTESVTVPAGTFNAMKVQVNTTTQANRSGITFTIMTNGFEWFATGVGHVKSSENVTFNGKPVSTVTGELQSYHIP